LPALSAHTKHGCRSILGIRFPCFVAGGTVSRLSHCPLYAPVVTALPLSRRFCVVTGGVQPFKPFKRSQGRIARRTQNTAPAAALDVTPCAFRVSGAGGAEPPFDKRDRIEKLPPNATHTQTPPLRFDRLPYASLLQPIQPANPSAAPEFTTWPESVHSQKPSQPLNLLEGAVGAVLLSRDDWQGSLRGLKCSSIPGEKNRPKGLGVP
jgi:hypothetical protein